jgi:hypothetical protein
MIRTSIVGSKKVICVISMDKTEKINMVTGNKD